MADIKIKLTEQLTGAQGIETRCRIENVDTLLEREIALALAHYLDPIVKQYVDMMAKELSAIAGLPISVLEEQPQIH